MPTHEPHDPEEDRKKPPAKSPARAAEPAQPAEEPREAREPARRGMVDPRDLLDDEHPWICRGID